MDSNINNLLCMSVKNKKQFPHIQCPHPRKFGEYCGIHHKAKNIIRIDCHDTTAQPSPPSQVPSVITPLPNTTIPTVVPITVPPTAIGQDRQDLISVTLPPKVIVKVPTLRQTQRPRKSKYLLPSDLPLQDPPNWKKIIQSCMHYKIDFHGTPEDFKNALCEWLTKCWISEESSGWEGPGLSLHCGPLIQSQGSGLECATNQTEFYDMIPIDEIPEIYLFSFEEACNYYVCDIRSFRQIVKRTASESDSATCRPKNPYTNMEVGDGTMSDYHKRIFLLQQNRIPLDYPQDIIDPDKQYELDVLEIFQKIYHFGWHVDHHWYLDLDPAHILRRRFYFRLEDLWNYRLGLSNEQRQLIVPTRKIFTKREKLAVDNMSDKDLKVFLVDRMKSLVTDGNARDDRANGAMYILLALIQVSRSAATALPVLCNAIGYSSN